MIYCVVPEPLADELYPKLADFRSLARRFDPAGKFANEFLARTIGL